MAEWTATSDSRVSEAGVKVSLVARGGPRDAPDFKFPLPTLRKEDPAKETALQITAGRSGD